MANYRLPTWCFTSKLGKSNSLSWALMCGVQYVWTCFIFAFSSADCGKYNPRPALSLHDLKALNWLKSDTLHSRFFLDRLTNVSRPSKNITCCSRIWGKLIWSCWLHRFSAHVMLPPNLCISHTLTVFLSIMSSTSIEVWCKLLFYIHIYLIVQL